MGARCAGLVSGGDVRTSRPPSAPAFRATARVSGVLHLRTSDAGVAGECPGRGNKEDEMSTATLSNLDVQVRDRVLHQLEWDPEVDASGVGVTAKNGVVTLTGSIDT